MFWIICILLALGVATYLVRPLLRPHNTAETAPDIAFYKAQLTEIDRDVARDVLSASEAERARAEVSRRLITADARQTTHDKSGPTKIAAVLGVAVIGLISAVTYLEIGAPGEPDLPLAQRHQNAEDMRKNRPNQAALEAAAPDYVTPTDVPAAYLEQIVQLRLIMPQRPDDLRGWELLSFHEAELRNFAAAAAAQAKVVALKDDAATIDDQRLQLDYMVAATDGYVSPEAEALARTILSDDANHMPARYYLGALAHQTDRSDIAFRLWQPLVDSGEDTFHIALARLQIADAAARAGVDYTLPDAVGPTAQDLANADDMSPEDRTAMIEGMVGQLSSRLADQGGSATEWARLIAAFGVLGDTENANAVWIEAQSVFATDVAAMTRLRNAAIDAGVAE